MNSVTSVGSGGKSGRSPVGNAGNPHYEEQRVKKAAGKSIGLATWKTSRIR